METSKHAVVADKFLDRCSLLLNHRPFLHDEVRYLCDQYEARDHNEVEALSICFTITDKLSHTFNEIEQTLKSQVEAADEATQACFRQGQVIASKLARADADTAQLQAARQQRREQKQRELQENMSLEKARIDKLFQEKLARVEEDSA